MSDDKDEVESPDPHFEPIISLPPVQVKTLEEDEEELLRLRAKLFRYDTSGDREWKERGTGDVKILKHKEHGTCRLLMRRDKTYKICANHYILPILELKPNCGSDRAWVWTTPADFADEAAKEELLAIRFANADNAQRFREVFEEAKALMKRKFETEKKESRVETTDVEKKTERNEKEDELQKEKKKDIKAADDEVSDKLEKLTVGESSKDGGESSEQSEPSKQQTL